MGMTSTEDLSLPDCGVFPVAPEGKHDDINQTYE
jgi:hypothetical protein